MRSSNRIVLGALKKEHSLLCKRAEKAKLDVDQYISIGDEFLSIHLELTEIIESGLHNEEVISRLEILKKRRSKAQKILGKNFISLLDRQSELEAERDSLLSSIRLIEFRNSL